MKRLIAAAVLAAFLAAGLTACGKKRITDNEDTSRVLYSDSEESTNSESDTATDSDTEGKETETDTKSSESDKKTDTDKKSDTDKKKESSKKDASSKAETPKTTISKATPSKTVSAKETTSKAASSSEVTSSESSSKSESSKAVTDSDKNSDTDTSKDTETDTETNNSDVEKEPIDPFDESVDLGFSYGSAWIDLYDDLDDVIDMIGEPDEINDVIQGRFGMVKEYDYSSKGFVITAYPNNVDNDYYMVYSIKITSETVRTEKDVAIGSPEEAIYDIYGKKGCEHTGDIYTYRSENGNEMLMFYVEKGYITKIVISASDV